MNHYNKISPVLEPFLNDQSGNAEREAIVVLDPAKTPQSVRIEDFRQTKDREAFLEAKRQSFVPLSTVVAEKYHDVVKTRKHAPFSTKIDIVQHGYLPVGKVSVTKNTVLDLAEIEEVVAILPNLKVSAISPKGTRFSDPSADERRDEATWALSDMRVSEVWQRGFDGSGVSVAVLDTGVFGKHHTLAERISDFVVVDQAGEIHRLADGATFDADRHGTHVCGTIAGGKTADGISIGVAPGSTLMVGAVLVGRSTLWTLMSGLDWAARGGARVVNLSLGIQSYEPKLAEVCRILLDDLDVLPVAAIGNNGHGNTSSPGNVMRCLGIGAVEKGYRGRLAVSHFSGGASLVIEDSGGQPGIVNKPDLVAPGSDIYSAVPPEDRFEGPYTCAYMDGTSMATPHVSGLAALLMQAAPDASAQKVLEAIVASAKPGPRGTGIDNRWGRGVVDPLGALEILRA